MSTPYTPKGSMCMACQHAARDCSALPFGAMPVIERSNVATIIQCVEFVRANAA